jgi:hypothetical protein
MVHLTDQQTSKLPEQILISYFKLESPDSNILLQTRVPRLKFGTWRNSACAVFRTYSKHEFQYFLGYPVCPQGFSSYRGYRNLLAERIHVRLLGHPGRIQRSYLYDLCDHDIQAYICDGRGLRIQVLLRALFGCL